MDDHDDTAADAAADGTAAAGAPQQPAERHREPLSRERIIDVALRIVDGQGLSRLTMRRLGDALEVEAMAIYHHLPRGKEELLDGLLAHVAMRPAGPPRRAGDHDGGADADGDVDAAATPDGEGSGGDATSDGDGGGGTGPLDALRTWAGDYRDRLLRHSGVLPLLVTRRNPRVLAGTLDSLAELLRRAGAGPVPATDGAHALLGYVIGQTALQARAAAAPEPLDSAATADWDRRFDSGLDMVLTGVLGRF